MSKTVKYLMNRRSPHGERGLKFGFGLFRLAVNRRSPHGERGLKFRRDGSVDIVCVSLPTRGAWIEIKAAFASSVASSASLPTRGAWIEMQA